MADWAEPLAGDAGAPAAIERSDSGAQMDERFRAAIAEDLDLPAALVVMNEAISSPSIANVERRSLLLAWDAVLGLDLDRTTRQGTELPAAIIELVRQRDEARAAKDYAASDALRDRLTTAGYEVMDTPEGTKVRPRN
jgi:cysteinyl-tRNA synthetase